MSRVFDERDVSDTSRFIMDLCDIGVIDRGDRMSLVNLMNGRDALLPQAVSQACISFLVNQRKDDIPPVARARYIIAAARVQHTRLTTEENP